MSAYEIIALRYARHDRPASENFLYPASAGEDPHDYPMPIDYFVWVIRDKERTIVVDTGFDHPAAQARGRKLLQHPVEGLRTIGVGPADVRDVVITHLHYDHAGNLGAFPNARFHLQDSEIEYATGRCMCRPRLRYPFDVEDVVTMIGRVYAGRVNFIDGNAGIAPGISLHHVPGHTRPAMRAGGDGARTRCSRVGRRAFLRQHGTAKSVSDPCRRRRDDGELAQARGARRGRAADCAGTRSARDETVSTAASSWRRRRHAARGSNRLNHA
jgi:hypothetical protein